MIQLIKQSGTLPQNEMELQFDFSNHIVDVLGRPVYQGDLGYIAVDVKYEDETAPVIKSIKVINNRTITLYFNEKLSYKGSWIIKNEDGEKAGVLTSRLDSDGNSVTLISSHALSEGEYFTLSMASTPRDLANNSYIDREDSWIIRGVSTEPEQDFVGLQMLNAKIAKITGDNVDEFLLLSDVELFVDGKLLNPSKYTVHYYDRDSDAMLVELISDELVFEENKLYKVRINGMEESNPIPGVLGLDALINVTTSGSNTVLGITVKDS